MTVAVEDTAAQPDPTPPAPPAVEGAPSPALMPTSIQPQAAPAAEPTPVEPAASVPAAAPAQSAAVPDDEDDDEDLEDLEIPRNLRQARKLRNENKSLRTRLQEFETERQQYQDAQTALVRYEVAAQYAIADPQSIALIGSGSREDMERNASYIAALRAQAAASVAAPTPPPTDRPVEGLRPGASPEPPAAPDDTYPAAWAPTRVRNQ